MVMYDDLEPRNYIESEKYPKSTRYVSIRGVDYNSGFDGVDSTTNTLQTMSYEHREIHSGSHYFISNVISNLPINNVADIQITTPDTTKWAHFVFKIEAEAETMWYLYENVAINTAGTSLTPINNHRNSTNTSGLTTAIILNASVADANADTAVAGATLLETGIIGSGKDSGTDIRDEKEIVLKQNTSYSIRFVATAAGYIDYRLSWYEHTNKN